jgi:uncharacterized protein with beta-barrel porin domain
MKRALFLSSVIAGIIASPGSFAQQVINGAAPTPLNATGVTSGVSMTGQGGGGTLIVGTIGGPKMDIFANNSSGGNVTNPLLRAVSTDASSLSDIVFNSSSDVFGAIGITNPGGPFFRNINGGNNGTAVNFNGSLFGTIATVSGTGSLNFNSGSTNISATNFAGNGIISLAPNTTLIGALTTNTANTGTLSLASGSALTGAVGGANGLRAVNVVGGSNTAGVSASISGAVNAYAFNLGTNTLNIGGALTIANQTASGVINTTLASASVYGNIRPVGATNLGSTLLINVAVPQTAFFPVGTFFDIVQTQAGTLQSGTNGAILVVVNDPTNPLYTFAAEPAAGTVAGQVRIRTTGIPLTAVVTPPPGIVLPPVLPIAAPVVPALIAAAAATPAVAAPVTPVPVVPGVTPPVTAAVITNVDLITVVLPAINAISNVTTVVTAVAQLAPSNAALAAPLVTFERTRAFQNILSSHINAGACGGGGQSSNERLTYERKKPAADTTACPSNQYSGLWLKGFGYFGDQGAQGAYSGYDSKIFGAMLGYDVPFSYDTRVGLGLGYARSTIGGTSVGNSTGFNSYQATAYVTHEDGTWFANGNLSYAWNSYSGRRQITFPGLDRTALAKYAGEDVTTFVTAGRHFFMDGYTITPLVSLQATHVGLKGYTETGAGDVNLQVASQGYGFLESGLGVDVARYFDMDDGSTILPKVHFKWLHDIVGQNFQNVSTFTAAGSTSFITSGLSAAPDTLNVGAGITLLSCACDERTWSVEASYDFYWRSRNYSANQVMLAAAYRF